jgi:hypothetical protein
MGRAWVYALVVDWDGGGGLIEEFCFGQGDEICGVIWFGFWVKKVGFESMKEFQNSISPDDIG